MYPAQARIMPRIGENLCLPPEDDLSKLSCVDLKNALFRVENKTYGVCKVTGKLISKERLKIVPHATMSIEAKNLQR